MLDEINILYILFPALVVVCIVAFIARSRDKKEADPLKKAVLRLKWQLVGLGVFCVALWLSLPPTAVSSTFGYPHSVEKIKTPELLLDYLQQAHKDLVRTTQVLHYFLFFFITGFLTTFYNFIKTIGQLAAERDGN